PAKPAVIRPFLATGWRAGQRQLVCSPLYHAAGLAPFVEGLASGNTAVVPAVFDAHRLGDLVDAHAVDWLQMTPFHMAAILGGTRPLASWHAAHRVMHVADHCAPWVEPVFHVAPVPTSVDA